MKKLVISLLLSIMFSLAVPMVISQAADVNTVIMEEEGEQARVSLILPNTVGDEITSLKLQFQIRPKEESLETIYGEFVFADSLPGLMKEYRYQQDKGILTIYITGRTGIFDQTNGEALLGTLSVKDQNQNPVKAEIMVQENGLEIENRVNQMQTPILDNTSSVVIGGERETDSSEEESTPDETQESQEESSETQTTSPNESSAEDTTESEEESGESDITQDSQENDNSDPGSSQESNPSESMDESTDISGETTDPSVSDVSDENSEGQDNGEEESVSTGDSAGSLIWMVAAVASAGVIVVIALIYMGLKIKRKND